MGLKLITLQRNIRAPFLKQTPTYQQNIKKYPRKGYTSSPMTREELNDPNYVTRNPRGENSNLAQFRMISLTISYQILLSCNFGD